MIRVLGVGGVMGGELRILGNFWIIGGEGQGRAGAIRTSDAEQWAAGPARARLGRARAERAASCEA